MVYSCSMIEKDHTQIGEPSSPPCQMHEFEDELLPPPPRGFRVKRVHAPAEPADGYRVLVDRLWPRGISRARAALDEWLADVGPSPALRKWFSHSPRRFAEFRRRYRRELRANDAAVTRLRALGKRRRITLLYAAKDARCNHAVVLAEFLTETPRRAGRSSRAR